MKNRKLSIDLFTLRLLEAYHFKILDNINMNCKLLGWQGIRLKALIVNENTY